MTELENLLLIPDVHLRQDTRLSKMRYDISPYWTSHQFNENIMFLKKHMEKISPLYLKKSNLLEFLKDLNEIFRDH